MKSKLEQYVENIVQHTECSKKEKEDLKEELLVHLELSRDDFIQAGMSVEEAEKRAMETFGKEGEIGHQLQQSLFPYRKELMLTLAISSLLFTITLYVMRLFIAGDAHIVWLSISMSLNGLLLFLPLNQQVHLNKKKWLNSLFILHIFGQLYGWLLITQMPHESNVGLTIWIWLNIAVTIGLVYQTTIYDYDVHNKQLKLLHGMNITSGLIIIGACLFFIFGGLIMIGTFHPIMLLFASPMAIWGLLYFVQLKLARADKKIALVIGIIPFLLAIGILLWMYLPPLFL